MSQERMHYESSNTQFSDDVIDIQEELKAAESLTNQTLVTHGSNQNYFDELVGKNVGDIKKSLREVFNIPSDANALINSIGGRGSQEVGDDYEIKQGDWLEFVKDAGVKGCF